MNLREWALPVYTILMQLATGALLVLWVIRVSAARKLEQDQIGWLVKRPLLIILLTVLAAMVGAQLHLGRPQFSFLAVLNLRSSWLSREILFTVLFFATVTVLVVAQWFRPRFHTAISLLGWLAVTCGVIAIYCMARIYDLAVQVAWNSGLTTASFYATTVLLGVTALAAMLLVDTQFRESTETEGDPHPPKVLRQTMPWLAITAGVVFIATVWLNVEQVRLLEGGNELAQTSLELLLGLYLPLFALRLGAILFGVASFAFAASRMARGNAATTDGVSPLYLGFLLILVGEILGRFLFYATHIRQGI